MNYFYNTRNITYMQQVDKENSIKFGLRVKEIRESMALSMNELYLQKGGKTIPTLSRVEKGCGDPKLSTLIKISSVLNLTIDELVKGIDFDYTIVEE